MTRTISFAEHTGVISAVLYQVPNQPIELVEIPGIPGQNLIYNGGRSEDGIIARQWRMFIATGTTLRL